MVASATRVVKFGRSGAIRGNAAERYGKNFAKGYRENATLGTVLKSERLDTLDYLLKKKR
jgi:hypothetical protein